MTVRIARWRSTACAALIASTGFADLALAQASQSPAINSVAYVVRGKAYAAMNERERAIESFAQAMKLDPICPVVLRERALIHDRFGESGQATEYYGVATDVASALAAYPGLHGRARAYLRIRDYESAIKSLDEAVRLEPGSATFLSERCYVRAITGRSDDAIADCNASLRIRPNDSRTLDSRAFAHLRKDALKEAITDYDSALRIAPKLPHALYGRGIARQRAGDTEGGRISPRRLRFALRSRMNWSEMDSSVSFPASNIISHLMQTLPLPFARP